MDFLPRPLKSLAPEQIYPGYYILRSSLLIIELKTLAGGGPFEKGSHSASKDSSSSILWRLSRPNRAPEIATTEAVFAGKPKGLGCAASFAHGPIQGTKM